jgi:hypothetical protein
MKAIIVIYMPWLELCIYTSLPCVFLSFQVAVYLWGMNENKYMSEAVNTVGSYCTSMLDPDSTMGLRAERCNSLPQDPSKTATEPFQGMSQELSCSYKPLFSLSQSLCWWVKIEVCGKFLCYLVWSVQISICYWTVMTEPGGTRFQIMPSYLPEIGIQCQRQEQKVLRNQPHQPTQQAVIQMCCKIYFRSPRGEGNILRKLC